MTLLINVVTTSQRVAETSSQLEKKRAIAECLRTVAPDEIPIAIAYLSGETCQGKLGVSFASLQTASTGSAPQATLTLHDVDDTFSALAGIKGIGASAMRTDALRTLF